MNQLNSVATFNDSGSSKVTAGMLLGNMRLNSDSVDTARQAAIETFDPRSPMGTAWARQCMSNRVSETDR